MPVVHMTVVVASAQDEEVAMAEQLRLFGGLQRAAIAVSVLTSLVDRAERRQAPSNRQLIWNRIAGRHVEHRRAILGAECREGIPRSSSHSLELRDVAVDVRSA